VPTPAQISKQLAALFKRFGYNVSSVIRDPGTNDRPYLFYVDNCEFADREGVSTPTAVRFSPTTRDVTFEGFLASELEAILTRATETSSRTRLALR
jgi:hypothetical protein